MMKRIFDRLILSRDLAGYELSHARGLMTDDEFQKIRRELEQSLPPLGDVSEVVSVLFFFFSDPVEVERVLVALDIEDPKMRIQEFLNSKPQSIV